MSSSKKIYLYRGFAAGILLHIGNGGRGRELNQREGERGNRGVYRSQRWVENNNMKECMQKSV